MKKTIETILGLVCFLAVILAGAENPDGSCNLLWTLSCLAVAGLSGWAYGKITKTTK